MNSDTAVAQETSEPEEKRDITIQYVLDSTDGLLVQCRDKNEQEVYIPFSLLVARLEKELVRGLRSKGFALKA